MKNKINIAWLLKNCTNKQKLYSPVIGECYLEKVSEDGTFISVSRNNIVFDKYGVLYGLEEGGECLLFPSKGYRSWEGVTIKNGELSTPEVNPQPTYGKYYCYGDPKRSNDIKTAFEKHHAKYVIQFYYACEGALYYIDNLGNIQQISRDPQVEQELIAQGYKKLKLPYQPKDKELVWCYDSISNYSRTLRFYDAKNRCTFQAEDGTRDGIGYESYEPYQGEYPEWAKEALKHLED